MLKPSPGNDDGYCIGNMVGAAAFVYRRRVPLAGQRIALWCC